jgi:hypothetical protein
MDCRDRADWRELPGSSRGRLRFNDWNSAPSDLRRRRAVSLRLLKMVVVLALGCAPGVFAARAPADAGGRELAWVAAASVGLDRRAIDTLARIKGADRQLLALRAYLRAGATLTARWSWSQQQLSAYPTTAEGKAASADIDAVEAAFATANPGYSARANRMPRSLEQQLEHWNENQAVAGVGAELAASLAHELPLQSVSSDRIREALMQWKPGNAAPLAAPGLSAHGQGRAFDFQIERDGHTVAGFDATAARREWDANGWTARLHAAVVASGKPFAGPLQSPYEPWHYAYLPLRGD